MIRACAWLSLIFILSAGSSPAAPAVIISGRVAARDGKALAGAQVALYTANAAPGAPPLSTAQTLDNGSFVIRTDAPGQYHLSVTKEDYITVGRDLDVPLQGMAALELVLTPLPTLQLRLVRPDGAPAPRGSALIWMLVTRRSDLDYSWGVWATRPVGADGSVEIKDSPGKSEDDVTRVDVMARETGIGSAQASFNGWPAAPETLKLQAGVALSVQALDDAGHPVAGATIKVNGMDLNLERRFLQGDIGGIANDEGKITLPTLLPGRYDISVTSGSGRVVHRQKITLGDRPAAAIITPADRLDPDTNMMDFRTARELQADQGVMPVPWTAPVRDLQWWPSKLNGTVKSGVNGAPLPGATVVLFHQFTQSLNAIPVDVGVSRADGSYTLLAPAPGLYFLGTTKYGKYPTRFQTIHVGALKPGALDLLIPPYPILRLNLLTGDGKPAPAANYSGYMVVGSARTDNINYLTEQTTQPGDTLEIDTPEPLPAAPYSVELTLRSPTAGFAKLRFDHWPKKPVSLKLDTARIVGRVLDASGRPVQGAEVIASLVETVYNSLRMPAYIYVTTDADGRFTLTSLCRGIWIIRAETSHADGQSAFIDISKDESAITLRLPGGLILKGKLIGRDGQPAAHGQVTLYRGGGNVSGLIAPLGSALTDPDGTFEIDGIPSAGEYLLTARLTDGAGLAKIITLFQPATSVILKAGEQQ